MGIIVLAAFFALVPKVFEICQKNKSLCAENGLPISSIISKCVQQITQLLQTLFSATPVKRKSDIIYKRFIHYKFKI